MMNNKLKLLLFFITTIYSCQSEINSLDGKWFFKNSVEGQYNMEIWIKSDELIWYTQGMGYGVRRRFKIVGDRFKLFNMSNEESELPFFIEFYNRESKDIFLMCTNPDDCRIFKRTTEHFDSLEFETDHHLNTIFEIN